MSERVFIVRREDDSVPIGHGQHDHVTGVTGYLFAADDGSAAMIASLGAESPGTRYTVFAGNDVEWLPDATVRLSDGWPVASFAALPRWEDFQNAVAASLSLDADIRSTRLERVQAIVKETVAAWIAERPEVSSGWCITQGPCVEFAEEVFDKIVAEFPAIDIAVEHSDDFAEEQGLEFGGYHAYLRIEDRYYDSQAQGVPNPLYLPFIASEHRYALMRASESDEDNEDFSLTP